MSTPVHPVATPLNACHVLVTATVEVCQYKECGDLLKTLVVEHTFRQVIIRFSRYVNVRICLAKNKPITVAK